jgi:hypothetical protein
MDRRQTPFSSRRPAFPYPAPDFRALARLWWRRPSPDHSSDFMASWLIFQKKQQQSERSELPLLLFF